MAHPVTRRLDGVLRRRAQSTLRMPGPVRGDHGVVPAYVEVLVFLHEGEAVVGALGEATLQSSQLQPAPVEPYVSVVVLYQVECTVAVHKLFFEQAIGLSLRLKSGLWKEYYILILPLQYIKLS